MLRALVFLGLAALLSACDMPATGAVGAEGTRLMPVAPDTAPPAFVRVVSQVEPVAEQACRDLTRGVDCDLLILVDRRPEAGVNAFQSLDRSGRPVIVFTAGMIESARNPDELAFVLSHEAAHHIAGHLAAQAEYAAAGAVVFAEMATRTGGTADDIATAQELGAFVGARAFSKDFELEADRLGTAIAYRAGFDPLIGAAFFARIPDPGDQFLGTHPPNAARMQMVRQTLTELRANG